MKHIFILQHTHKISPDNDDTKLIGAFSTLVKAREAKKKLLKQPSFKKTPRGFYISKYPIDEIFWKEGFVTSYFKK